MHSRSNGTTPWQKVWKFITNPTVEVIVAIVVVLGAAWIVVETDSMQRKASPFPVPFGHK